MRALFATVLGLGAVALTAGCQTIDGTASAPSGQVSAYRAEQSSAAAVRARVQAIALCEQAIPSMAAMVREYNAFINALNKTQSYTKLRGLDTKAREQLAVGANEIRPKLTNDLPVDLADSVREFLSAGASLNNLIGAKQSAQLNSVAAVWTRERQATIDLCARYIPSASTQPRKAPSSSKAVPSTSSSRPSSSVPARPS
ncbi:hypothetical protein GOEFS_077_00280 [Gordonia effusa NBRC 100432]|uniref:Lipoprotein n=1 Tax=Gordonia effusa NBRC 100432 TaxID=1077974 RepID=H0R2D5_9ACTN|nr:hypothetical protein [Gordonia effusa]GAB19236.1 hypothetical protein GOEFS_077_00280 [Gordonia effusa NBRC 100432]